MHLKIIYIYSHYIDFFINLLYKIKEMDQNPIQKPAHPPPRTKTRVIIGSSQIKRTAPHAANSTQNRNFNQVTTSTGGDSSTNTQSTNTRHNWNSNKASSK